jgi:hypothetical protein
VPPPSEEVEGLLKQAVAQDDVISPATRSRDLPSYVNTATERIAGGVRRLGAVPRCRAAPQGGEVDLMFGCKTMFIPG